MKEKWELYELLMEQYLQGEISKEQLRVYLQDQYPQWESEIAELESLEAVLQQLSLSVGEGTEEEVFDRVEQQLMQEFQRSGPVSSSLSVVGKNSISAMLGVIAAGLGFVGILLFVSPTTELDLDPVGMISPFTDRYLDTPHFTMEMPNVVVSVVESQNTVVDKQNEKGENLRGAGKEITSPSEITSTDVQQQGFLQIEAPPSPLQQQIQQLTERLQRLEQQSAPLATRLAVQRQLGILYRQIGALEQSQTLLQDALRIAERSNLRLQTALLQGELALTLARQGKYEDGGRLLQQCVQTLRVLRHPAYQRWQAILHQQFP